MNLKQLLASAFLAASTIAMAADEEVEKLLTSMRDAYKGVKTAKMTTVTTLRASAPDSAEVKEMKATFEISFKGPDKAYIYTDNLFGADGKVKLVSDGKTITLTTPDEKEEIPFSIEAMSGLLPLNLESICFWDFKRQLNTGENGNMRKSEFKLEKDKEWNERKWTVLEETAHEQGVYVRYWIDPKTHFIWRSEVHDIESKAKVMDCMLTKLETGLTLDDGLFGG